MLLRLVRFSIPCVLAPIGDGDEVSTGGGVIDSLPAPVASAADILRDYYYPNRQQIKTVDDLIEMWLHSQRIKSDASKYTYRQIAYKLLRYLDAEYNLPDLRLCTLEHLQAFLKWLSTDKVHTFTNKDGNLRPRRNQNGDFKKGLKQNAIAKYVCGIRSLWKFGCKESIGYFSHNIAQELAVDWSDNTAKRVLTERQILKLEEAALAISKRHWLLFNFVILYCLSNWGNWAKYSRNRPESREIRVYFGDSFGKRKRMTG